MLFGFLETAFIESSFTILEDQVSEKVAIQEGRIGDNQTVRRDFLDSPHQFLSTAIFTEFSVDDVYVVAQGRDRITNADDLRLRHPFPEVLG